MKRDDDNQSVSVIDSAEASSFMHNNRRGRNRNIKKPGIGEFNNQSQLKQNNNNIGLNNYRMGGELKQKKMTSSWSHQYRPAQKKTDTYKFGSKLEGIETSYKQLLKRLNLQGKKFQDKDFPPVWESIRGNGKNDYRM